MRDSIPVCAIDLREGMCTLESPMGPAFLSSQPHGVTDGRLCLNSFTNPENVTVLGRGCLSLKLVMAIKGASLPGEMGRCTQVVRIIWQLGWFLADRFALIGVFPGSLSLAVQKPSHCPQATSLPVYLWPQSSASNIKYRRNNFLLINEVTVDLWLSHRFIKKTYINIPSTSCILRIYCI